MRLLSGVMIAALAAGLQGPAYGQDISETLAGPVRDTLSSTKRPVDLEFCVSDAITQTAGAIPLPIRMNDNDVMILGYGHTPKLIIVLKAISTGSVREIHTRGSDMDKRLTAHIRQRCGLAN